MKKRKVYIAGPMRGYVAYNFRNFFLAEDALEKAGLCPVNPAAIDAEKYGQGIVFNMKDTLIDDMKELVRCDAIYMLKGWEDSMGARAEYYFAKAIGLPVSFEDEEDAKKERGHDEGTEDN
jgi:nucleoside 2-deoxyribosyltransferase